MRNTTVDFIDSEKGCFSAEFHSCPRDIRNTTMLYFTQKMLQAAEGFH